LTEDINITPEENNQQSVESAKVLTWEEKEKKNRRRGWIFSITFHTILLLLAIIFGLFSQTPPPGEEGILVNFGHSESGGGEQAATAPEPVTEPTEASPDPVTEEVVTQNTDAAPAIKQEKKTTEKVEEQPKKEEPKVNTDALMPSKIKKDGTGQGNKKGIEDMGAPDGDPKSDVYGPKSYGKGTKGTGWDLEGSGRRLMVSPEPDNKSQDGGKVVIRIKVDSNGRVVSAEFVQKGSTTTDSYLITEAKRASMKARFNANKDQKGLATGHFTYNFKFK
jgi:TonB family protein